MNSVQRRAVEVNPAADAERVYTGMRTPAGAPVVMVSASGYGGGYLRHVQCHGAQLDWGYLGTGAADLALSLLADALGERLASPVTPAEGPQRAWRHYRDFKVAFVARWPRSGEWRITRAEIVAWVAEQERSEAAPSRWPRLMTGAAVVWTLIGLYLFAVSQVAVWFVQQVALAGLGR